jgi:integrase
VARNVAAIVGKPKLERTPVEPLDLEQTRALLSAASGDRLEVPLRVAVHLGLRLGELLAVRWADIDFATARLQVAHTLHRLPKTEASGWRLAQPKSKRSRRVLLLAPAMLEALRERFQTPWLSPRLSTSGRALGRLSRRSSRQEKATQVQGLRNWAAGDSNSGPAD